MIMESKQYDFSDIAPYDDSIFKEKMASLVVDPGFLHAVNYTMPKEDVPVDRKSTRLNSSHM